MDDELADQQLDALRRQLHQLHSELQSFQYPETVAEIPEARARHNALKRDVERVEAAINALAREIQAGHGRPVIDLRRRRRRRK